MEAHSVDIHVGKKLRSRRTMLGRSQEEIGTAVGITFQQIQKYERGMNRIGASRLFEFATLLGVSVAYFFEGLEYGGKIENAGILSLSESEAPPFEYENTDNKEILSLVRAYCSVSPQIRKKILSLIKSISNEKDEDESHIGIAANERSKVSI